jgi:hypothetical protein
MGPETDFVHIKSRDDLVIVCTLYTGVGKCSFLIPG